jgi:prevent-host-death family protein
MKVINMHAAKTHLSRLVEEVVAGEDVVIAKGGRPVVRLVPFAAPAMERVPGSLRGRLKIGRSLDHPLPDDLAAAFGMKP